MALLLTVICVVQDGLNVVSEARVAGEDLQGRHKRRKNKEERMQSVLEGQHLYFKESANHSLVLHLSFLLELRWQAYHYYVWAACLYRAWECNFILPHQTMFAGQE